MMLWAIPIFQRCRDFMKNNTFLRKKEKKKRR